MTRDEYSQRAPAVLTPAVQNANRQLCHTGLLTVTESPFPFVTDRLVNIPQRRTVLSNNVTTHSVVSGYILHGQKGGDYSHIIVMEYNLAVIIQDNHDRPYASLDRN